MCVSHQCHSGNYKDFALYVIFLECRDSCCQYRLALVPGAQKKGAVAMTSRPPTDDENSTGDNWSTASVLSENSSTYETGSGEAHWKQWERVWHMSFRHWTWHEHVLVRILAQGNTTGSGTGLGIRTFWFKYQAWKCSGLNLGSWKHSSFRCWT